MHKSELLEILACNICPVCKNTKAHYQWTCGDCYRPHQESDEHRALSDSCDEHMQNADRFLTRARRMREKPETD